MKTLLFLHTHTYRKLHGRPGKREYPDNSCEEGGHLSVCEFLPINRIWSVACIIYTSVYYK